MPLSISQIDLMDKFSLNAGTCQKRQLESQTKQCKQEIMGLLTVFKSISTMRNTVTLTILEMAENG